MTTVHKPAFSVIIPVYNYGAYLPEAIRSVEEQTCQDWEIVVIDDCSSDDSLMVAMDLQRKVGDHMKVISNKKNMGVGGARNAGCDVAQGEYLAFLDSDDSWAPQKLEVQERLLRAQSDLAMVHTGVSVFEDQCRGNWFEENEGLFKEIGHWDKTFNEIFPCELANAVGRYTRVLQHTSPICLSSVIMRRTVFMELGKFDADLKVQVEDWLLWLKCSLLFKMAFIPEMLTRYRIHAQSYTCRVFNTASYDWRATSGLVRDRCTAFARRKGLNTRYKDFGPCLPSVSRARRVAGRLFGAAKKTFKAFMVDRKGVAISAHNSAEGENVPPDASELYQLILFVTSACSLSCRACFYSSSLNAKNDMTVEQIRTIARTCGRPSIVLLTGGEPFLNKDLAEIAKTFLAKSMVSINTNGFLPSTIERVVSEIMASNPASCLNISVSLDGFEKTHNKMRSSETSYIRAVDTLRALVALREKHSGLAVTISTLIAPENMNEIVEFGEEMAAGFNPNYHNFEIERSSPEALTLFRGKAQDLEKLYRDLLAVVKAHYHCEYQTTRERYRRQYENVINARPWPWPCVAGRKAVVVYAHGRLAACELRSGGVDLSEYGYDLAVALRSKAMNEEISRIDADKCCCTHGCWLLTSMYEYLQQEHGIRDPEFVLRYRGVFDLLRHVPHGQGLALMFARKLEQVRRLLR